MKKKVVGILLLLTFLVGGSALFTSCKDYEDDLRAEMQFQNETLKKALEDQIAAVNQGLANINSCKCDPNLKHKVDSLEQLLGDIQSGLNAGNYNSVGDVINIINQINNAVNGSNGITGLLERVKVLENDTVRLVKVENTIKDLQKSYVELSQYDAYLKRVCDSLAQITADHDAKINTLLAAVDKNTTYWFNTDADGNYVFNSSDGTTYTLTGIGAGQPGKDGLTPTIDNDGYWCIGGVRVVDALGNPILARGMDGATVQGMIDNAIAQLKQSEGVCFTEERVIAIADSLDSLRQDIMKTYIAENYYNKSAIDVKVGDINTKLTALEAEDTRLAGLITQLQSDFKELQDAVDAIKKNLAKLVTSVIIQGTDNPVSGYQALPVNLQSNVLAAYYGNAANAVEFPSNRPAYYVFQEQASKYSSKDLAVYQGPKLSFGQGDLLLDDADDNAGKLYVTVNPNTVDFSGVNVSLVNSQDEEAGIKLGTLNKTDKVLTFGVTRAANNGFYEIPAKLSEGGIVKSRLNIDKSAIKTALKDVITPRDGINYVQVASAAYKTLNNGANRYGVKCAWIDADNEEHATYSNYAIGTAAISPLSYSFYKDGKNYTLPTITPLSDLLNIKAPSFNFSTEGINTTISIDTTVYLDTYVNVPSKSIVFTWDSTMVITPNANGTVTVSATHVDVVDTNGDIIGTADIPSKEALLELGIDPINITFNISKTITVDIGQINVKDTIPLSASADIRDFVDQLVGKMNGQVSDALDDVMGDINGQVTKVTDKVNGYINKVNDLVNRLNTAISDPNRRLQPTMVFRSANGNFGQMSTTFLAPSLFKFSGTGEKSTTLVATSWTGEILAPAFKKYVAVTNVFKPTSTRDVYTTAQNGDAECIAARDLANSQLNMNTVVRGREAKFPFVSNETYAKDNLIYEIVYSCLDYSGKIVTNKYYVQVKK